MLFKISQMIDQISEYLAHRKGLLPITGILLILLNLLFQVFPLGWISTSHLFLNLGVIVAIIGFMLAWVL
jgi:hypothetical protein